MNFRPKSSFLRIFCGYRGALFAAIVLFALAVTSFYGAEIEGVTHLAAERGTGRNVLVTGAGGRTGSLLMEELCGQTEFTGVYGMVRSVSKASVLQRRLAGLDDKVVEPHIVVGDVRRPKTLAAHLQGMDALVILTSAVPRVTRWSALMGSLKGFLGFKKVGRKYYFPHGQTPQDVDWLGQKAQIDAAKEAGVRHIVLVGSMAGTKPNHFLNTIGRGNILRWKRKAERYLIQSGIPYTIIHPGGLLDIPGAQRELVLGVDDELYNTKFSTVPRADVATVCLEALLTEEAKSRSFDLGSRPVGEGTPWDGSLRTLLLTLSGRNCKYDEPEWP